MHARRNDRRRTESERFATVRDGRVYNNNNIVFVSSHCCCVRLCVCEMRRDRRTTDTAICRAADATVENAPPDVDRDVSHDAPIFSCRRLSVTFCN